jgi:hypothetical protein
MRKYERPAGGGSPNRATVISTADAAEIITTPSDTQFARWLARRHFIRLTVATVIASQLATGGRHG